MAGLVWGALIHPVNRDPDFQSAALPPLKVHSQDPKTRCRTKTRHADFKFFNQMRILCTTFMLINLKLQMKGMISQKNKTYQHLVKKTEILNSQCPTGEIIKIFFPFPFKQEVCLNKTLDLKGKLSRINFFQSNLSLLKDRLPYM